VGSDPAPTRISNRRSTPTSMRRYAVIDTLRRSDAAPSCHAVVGEMR